MTTLAVNANFDLIQSRPLSKGVNRVVFGSSERGPLYPQ